jgi:hypothetical protein
MYFSFFLTLTLTKPFCSGGYQFIHQKVLYLQILLDIAHYSQYITYCGELFIINCVNSFYQNSRPALQRTPFTHVRQNYV